MGSVPSLFNDTGRRHHSHRDVEVARSKSKERRSSSRDQRVTFWAAKRRHKLHKMFRRKSSLKMYDDVYGFSFSPAGLLLPYHLGVIKCLMDFGYITERTPLAGASAGALATCIGACGMPMREALGAVMMVNMKCKEMNSTAGKLREILEQMLNDILPENSHEILNARPGKITITHTNVLPFKAQFISHFYSKKDLIECLVASCNIPFYFSGWPTVNCRGRPSVDGYFAVYPTSFGCPKTESQRVVRVLPFSKKEMNLNFSPLDCINPDLQVHDDKALTQLLAGYGGENPFVTYMLEETFEGVLPSPKASDFQSYVTPWMNNGSNQEDQWVESEMPEPGTLNFERQEEEKNEEGESSLHPKAEENPTAENVVVSANPKLVDLEEKGADVEEPEQRVASTPLRENEYNEDIDPGLNPDNPQTSGAIDPGLTSENPQTSGAIGNSENPQTSGAIGNSENPQTSGAIGNSENPQTSGAIGNSENPQTSGAIGNSENPDNSGAIGNSENPQTSDTNNPDSYTGPSIEKVLDTLDRRLREEEAAGSDDPSEDDDWGAPDDIVTDAGGPSKLTSNQWNWFGGQWAGDLWYNVEDKQPSSQNIGTRIKKSVSSTVQQFATAFPGVFGSATVTQTQQAPTPPVEELPDELSEGNPPVLSWTTQELLSIALNYSEQGTVTRLYQLGKADALRWILQEQRQFDAEATPPATPHDEVKSGEEACGDVPPEAT